ncbi:Hypothetical predicted protein [Podarcis lilfordi]|uniref:Uncharacterized protein n=1 Tax=Podarcis lilfordi TaxID=74358 RepID=A0AA35KL32_9SAUR|nr:Hypothetical predicted protein [Podarcis lilfordi]
MSGAVVSFSIDFCESCVQKQDASHQQLNSLQEYRDVAIPKTHYLPADTIKPQEEKAAFEEGEEDKTDVLGNLKKQLGRNMK